jgi:hypothetical protein
LISQNTKKSGEKSAANSNHTSNHVSNRSITEEDVSLHSISSYAYGSEIDSRSRNGTPHISNLESTVMDVMIHFQGKTRKCKVAGNITFDALMINHLPKGFTKDQLAFYDSEDTEWAADLAIVPSLMANRSSDFNLYIKEKEQW